MHSAYNIYLILIRTCDKNEMSIIQPKQYQSIVETVEIHSSKTINYNLTISIYQTTYAPINIHFIFIQDVAKASKRRILLLHAIEIG